MRSFGTFSLLATLACAAFTWAAPAPAPVSNALSALEARCGCSALPTIITEVTTKIEPLVVQLTYITKENCTVEIVTPILVEVKEVIIGAIGEVQLLVGETLDVVLATATGVLSLLDIAHLVSELLLLICGALAVVLKVVAVAEYKVIFPLVADVVIAVAQLLQLVLNTVGGLLLILLPLIGEVLSIVLSLGLTSHFAFLGVSWSTVTASTTFYTVTATATSVLATITSYA